MKSVSALLILIALVLFLACSDSDEEIQPVSTTNPTSASCPDFNTYFPLKVGNMWEYEGLVDSTLFNIQVKVARETLIVESGIQKKYFVMDYSYNNSNFSKHKLLRTDGDSLFKIPLHGATLYQPTLQSISCAGRKGFYRETCAFSERTDSLNFLTMSISKDTMKMQLDIYWAYDLYSPVNPKFIASKSFMYKKDVGPLNLIYCRGTSSHAYYILDLVKYKLQ